MSYKNEIRPTSYIYILYKDRGMVGRLLLFNFNAKSTGLLEIVTRCVDSWISRITHSARNCEGQLVDSYRLIEI